MALVVMKRPLRIGLQVTRVSRAPSSLPAFGRLRAAALAQFQPVTLVYTNGTHWRFQRPPFTPGNVAATTVRAACAFLGCTPTPSGVVARLLDAYPELEPRLRPVAQARWRTDRVRAAQPLLAALIVAHAVSVAHLMQHH